MIISLIYLALQVKASNQVSIISALASFAPRYEQGFVFLTRPENAKLYLTATEEYDDLEEEQKLRFRCFFYQCASVTEDFYLMIKMGVRIAEVQERETMIQRILRTPGGRATWKDIRKLFASDFREIIDVVSDAKGEIGLPF